MLGWFRVRRASLGAMLLVSLATFGGSIVVPHSDECHDHCVQAIVEHDASAHRFQAAGTSEDSSHPLHCLVCHSARTYRPRQQVAFQPGAPSGEDSWRIHPESFLFAPAALAAQPPLRSPPLA
jgi:hypothetical protein